MTEQPGADRRRNTSPRRVRTYARVHSARWSPSARVVASPAGQRSRPQHQPGLHRSGACPRRGRNTHHPGVLRNDISRMVSTVRSVPDVRPLLRLRLGREMLLQGLPTKVTLAMAPCIKPTIAEARKGPERIHYLPQLVADLVKTLS